MERKERPKVVRFGSYFRTSDSKLIQRFRCTLCGSTYSAATFHPCYRQKKRHKNEILRRFFANAGSQRGAARMFCLNRNTVARKFRFLGATSKMKFHLNNDRMPKAAVIEFDDLETFEHTKCKPISVTLAVESGSRRILGIEASSMPAKGLLVKRARKYGPRADERPLGRRRLFERIGPLIVEGAVVKSDSNPHYVEDVKRHFPSSLHRRYLGKRGSIGGQGELKKVKFDPLFSLNHTCAMLRAHVNRLFRKTWNTTKDIDRLQDHLMIYAAYHNENLPKISA